MFDTFPLTYSFNDVLLVPQYSAVRSRSDVDLSTHLSPHLKLDIPFVLTKMDTVCGVESAKEIARLGGIAIFPRFDKPEIQAEKVFQVANTSGKVAAAVGIKDGFIERAELMVKAGACAINIDVAHGHMQRALDATKALKQKFGDAITIISGSTATYEAARDHYKAGADCVFVGVGGGSTCLTRIKTGFGVPNVTSLFESARAAKEFGKTVLADSGMETSGDIVKALGTGAHAICSGFLFAATDESPGEIIEIDGKKYKRYNGSASKAEKIKQTGKSDHVEGAEGLVEYRGSLESVVEDLLFGVRSGLSYAGAHNIKEFHGKAKFVRVTQAGVRESGAHGILVKK